MRSASFGKAPQRVSGQSLRIKLDEGVPPPGEAGGLYGRLTKKLADRGIREAPGEGGAKGAPGFDAALPVGYSSGERRSFKL